MNRHDEIRALTLSWQEAWNSRDPERLAALFDDDGTYYDPELPSGPVPGQAGIRQNAEATFRDWPAALFEVVSLIVQEPLAALEWRSTATHRSGQVLTLEGVDLLEWRGHRLAAVRSYYDVHQRPGKG